MICVLERIIRPIEWVKSSLPVKVILTSDGNLIDTDERFLEIVSGVVEDFSCTGMKRLDGFSVGYTVLLLSFLCQ